MEGTHHGQWNENKRQLILQKCRLSFHNRCFDKWYCFSAKIRKKPEENSVDVNFFNLCMSHLLHIHQQYLKATLCCIDTSMHSIPQNFSSVLCLQLNLVLHTRIKKDQAKAKPNFLLRKTSIKFHNCSRSKNLYKFCYFNTNHFMHDSCC